MLQDKGLLNFDTPINKYLPGWKLQVPLLLN
jgi:CubicO group peptidase (beta-lactamase class C family)